LDSSKNKWHAASEIAFCAEGAAMITELHFLRPWWLLMLIPMLMLVLVLWRQTPKLQGWSEICDSHLLAHLLHNERQQRQISPLLCLFFSLLLMIMAIAGPAWHKLPVPTYKSVQPRVLILDMSEHMMNTDLTPNRLSRAKFKLHDLLAHKDVGQFGLVVYTGEPFVVSPLTDDGQTISALLTSLTPDLMPIGGQKLDSALDEGSRLIKQAGYSEGQLLVLTSDTPSTEAIDTANKLADAGIYSSIMPFRADKNLNPLFQKFAHAGGGELLPYSPDSRDLEQWLNADGTAHFKKNNQDEIPLWQDEGRWFLFPALLLFLPVFRRGWLQRMAL
jgi:Ca-activated chloride channel homolog